MPRGSGFKRTVQFAPTGRQWQGDVLPGPRSAPVRVSDGLARAIVHVPKLPKAKPGKRTPTKIEAEWMEKAVQFGCVACWIDKQPSRPTAIHHLLRGGQRIGHLFTIGLCDPGHHQGGDALGLVSRHPWKARFEKLYGSEMELLGMLKRELGVFDEYETSAWVGMPG